MNRPYEVDYLMRSLSNCAENIFLKKEVDFCKPMWYDRFTEVNRFLFEE